MELTLLVLIITTIVSIRRSAWYQRYKVRGAARVVASPNWAWIMVDVHGVAYACQHKPFLGSTLPLLNVTVLHGHYPALRNQVFKL